MYKQQKSIRLNFRTRDPVVTYLPKSSNSANQSDEKLAFHASIVVNLPNEIPDFYFEEKSKIKSVIAFFDPSMPSLNCMKIVELPNDYNIENLGPMMINNAQGYIGTGLTIQGKKYSSNQLFHLTKHNFEISFQFYSNSESIFNSKLIKEKQFAYDLANF